MPVSDDKAAQLIGIEALRSINKALEKLADKIDAQNGTLHEMDRRLIRMEANDAIIQSLVAKVDALERDKDRREGAVNLGQWFMKSPIVGWVVGALIAFGALVMADKQ